LARRRLCSVRCSTSRRRRSGSQPQACQRPGLSQWVAGCSQRPARRQGWRTPLWAAPGAPLIRRSRPTPARSSAASPSTRSSGWRGLAGTLQDPVETLRPSARDRAGRVGPGSRRSRARCCCPASSRCRRRRCGGATLSRRLQLVRVRRRADLVERCGRAGRPGRPPRDAVRIARGRAAVRQRAARWGGKGVLPGAFAPFPP